eukprot:8659190-Alexandrium_andersonii.AAC.1
MSASLVGSEMCIRDRVKHILQIDSEPLATLAAQDIPMAEVDEVDDPPPKRAPVGRETRER